MANTKKRWTADEIEILRKYYPAEGDQVCERLSGRTAKSCRIQASKMEISKNISSSATVQNDVKYVRLWTEAEDKILREYYAAEGSKVRYRLNQRSAESCRGRAAALGLTYSGANRKWSSSEDEILRNAETRHARPNEAIKNAVRSFFFITDCFTNHARTKRIESAIHAP